jgi:serine/threonine-protein kinase
MGTVMRGYDEVLERSVAIKFLRDDLAGDGPSAARFRREARIAASLAHPGIAQVYDLAEAEGRPFIVMELLDGTDLQALTGRGAVVDPGVAAGIVARAAEALGFAHAAGAVHRDVKPGNIVLTRAGAVKVTDFGIASAAQHTPLTESGVVMGTSWYVSPEQARGERATAASDVYALGCVLFQLLTGRPPYEAETSVAVAMAHVSDPVPSPVDVNPGVPPELDAIARRAMSKDPAHRYRDGTVMAAAIEATGLVPAAMSLAVADMPTNPVPGLPGALGAGDSGEPGPRRDTEGTQAVRRGPPTERLFEGILGPLGAAGRYGAAAFGPGLAGGRLVADPSNPAVAVTPVSDTPDEMLAGERDAGRRRRRRRRRLNPLAALLVLLVLGSVATAAWLTFRPKPLPMVIVSDWTGHNAQEAAAEARDLHLDVHAVTRSSVRPKDEVLDQQPKPHASVPAGSAITFFVSLGDRVRVPDVTGETLDDAERILQDADLTAEVGEVRPVDNLPGPLKSLKDLGIDLGIVDRFLGTTEKIVSAQDKRAGTVVTRGTAVRLTIVQHLVKDGDNGDGDGGSDGSGGDNNGKKKSRGND